MSQMASFSNEDGNRLPLNGDSARDVGQQRARSLRREFYIFALAFSLNHATVTTPLGYAASDLTNFNGQGQSAVLYGACLITSLFFSNLLFSILGSKKGLGISMGFYSVYVFSFAIAVSMCTKTEKGACSEATALQLPVAFIGALIGGVGAGLLWTCQGAFVTLLCERLAEEEGRPKSDVTADVMGSWGLIFLSCECAVRALTTVMTKYAKFSDSTAFFIWASFALLATVVFLIFASNFQSPAAARGSVLDKLLSAVNLWNDPKLWFLQCTNIAFAFAAAWLPGYVGRTILSPALGKDFIGFASALLSGLAAILSKVFGLYSQKIGKAPFLILGAAAFLCLGIFSKWVGNPVDWGWGTLIFYVFMGIGRAVYESTNKAIFSDFFPGEKSAGAFANVFVFNSGSSTVAFILGAYNIITPELYLLLAFAALTTPGYLAASLLQKRAIGLQTEDEFARPA